VRRKQTVPPSPREFACDEFRAAHRLCQQRLSGTFSISLKKKLRVSVMHTDQQHQHSQAKSVRNFSSVAPKFKVAQQQRAHVSPPARMPRPTRLLPHRFGKVFGQSPKI